LGERRAQSVREYLIGLGANGADLYTISYGLERLVSQGSTEDDHAKNRRVEVGVITK
jgi:peptidoglycan-associated lipoprotein